MTLIDPASFGAVYGKSDAATIDPASFGAVYGKSDAATVAANDAAVAQVLAEIAAAGGGDLVLNGSLAISQTVVIPPTITFNKVAGFPVHCSVRGESIDSELYKVNGGAAIRVQPFLPPANLPGRDARVSIERLGLCQGTLQVLSGTPTQPGLGKFLLIRDVRIYGNTSGTCLDINGFDGGHVENVNIHENPGCTGFSLANAHQCVVDITSRSNQMGGVVTSCGALAGSLYCESNAGLGLDLEGLARSHLMLWLENNNGNVLQGKRRNCWGNVFSGMVQADSNQSWDDDLISMLCNLAPSSPEQLNPLGVMIDRAIPGRNNWLIQPSAVANGNQLTVKADAFDSAAKNQQPCWVELQPSDALSGLPTGVVGGTWSAGDLVAIYVTITADAATKQWYAANPSAELLFATGCMAGTPPNISQRWSVLGPRTELVAFAPCTAAGSGLRLFCFPAAPLPGPAQDLNFTMSAVVRKVNAP